MGVTIHLQAKLKSENDYQKFIAKAKEFATEFSLKNTEIDEKIFPMFRPVKGRGEDNWEDYEGPVKGIFIGMEDQCEPLIMQFDENLEIWCFCKTQFAPIEPHIRVVHFFRKIEPLFEEFEVTDEGDYWETGDAKLLQEKIDFLAEKIAQIRALNPNPKGFLNLPDGKIIDFRNLGEGDEDGMVIHPN